MRNTLGGTTGELDRLTTVELYSLSAAAVVICVTGVWLTVAGRRYGSALQTVHKLVALVGFVAFGLLIYRQTHPFPLGPRAHALFATPLVLAVAAFATGGVLSASETAPRWVLWGHRIGSWLSVAFAAGVAWFVTWMALATL